MAVKPRDLALFGGADLAFHPIVAGEGRGHQVFHPVLDPFDRLAGDDRGDDGTNISRIDANLVAKAAADVGADDADVVLFDTGQQRGHGAHHVGRLKRAVNRQLAVHLVHAGHGPAGFQRARMGAVVVHRLFGNDLGIVDDLLGAFLVAHFPQEDVVVMLARAVSAAGLALEILSQNDVGLKRLERIDDHGQRLVFHFDQFHGVGGDIAVRSYDKGHFLPLKQHFAIGQHHLLVTGQRRHPMQAERFEVFGGQHCHHAGQSHRRIGIDRFHAGVGIGRAHEVAVQHARQLYVIDVIALALGKTGVFHAFARAAHAFQIGNPVVAGWGLVVHCAASLAAFISAAADKIDFTMFW